MLLRDRSNWPKVEPTKMLQQCSCLKQSNKSYLACLEDGSVVAGQSIVVSRSQNWWLFTRREDKVDGGGHLRGDDDGGDDEDG